MTKPTTALNFVLRYPASVPVTILLPKTAYGALTSTSWAKLRPSRGSTGRVRRGH